jgi:hypothetical protein|tara:strand:+ start:309 stop:509 length:201 start_codon:yes stop_codon:yes gene_type:complete
MNLIISEHTPPTKWYIWDYDEEQKVKVAKAICFTPEMAERILKALNLLDERDNQYATEYSIGNTHE